MPEREPWVASPEETTGSEWHPADRSAIHFVQNETSYFTFRLHLAVSSGFSLIFGGNRSSHTLIISTLRSSLMERTK